jgi:hypothetical protein
MSWETGWLNCPWGGYMVDVNGLIYLPDTTQKMSDDDYRDLINAKIVANGADGTIRDYWTFLTSGLGLDGANGYLLLDDNIGWIDATIIENDLLDQLHRYLINQIGPRAAGVTTEVKNWTMEYLDFNRYTTDPSKFTLQGDSINSKDSKYLYATATGGLAAVPIVYNYRILTAAAAYGQWDIWIKKKATTDPWFMPIAGDNSGHSDVTQDGYAINITASEEVRLYRITAGVSTQLFTTATGYTDNSWHKYTMTRDSATNTITVYMDDTLITVSSGSNPIVDATHTTSVYEVWEPGLNDGLGLVVFDDDTRLTDYTPE